MMCLHGLWHYGRVARVGDRAVLCEDGTWKPRAKLEAQKEEAKRHRNRVPTKLGRVAVALLYNDTCAYW